MKSVSNAVKDAIEQDHAVEVRARLIAEWEYNRFMDTTVTAATPSTADQMEYTAYFDLDSVALPNRPGAGAAKARFSPKLKAAEKYRDLPDSARFYPPATTDSYKYWSSLIRCGNVLTSGSYNFSSPVSLTVMYGTPVMANKIVVGFETSYAKPSKYTIQYTSNGTIWTTAGTDLAVPDDGIISLYRTTTGWSTSVNYENETSVRGVRIVVSGMDSADEHLDVIQLGARLENDITDRLIGYGVQMEAADRSFLAPLGRASSNTAKVSLGNDDGLFNNENSSSPYFGLIDKKVKFTVDLGIDAAGHGGDKYEWVREFTMWVDAWTGQETNVVEVDLKDSSVFLQETNMPLVFIENATVGAVVWEVLDRLGVSNYEYSRDAQESGQIIPFYWPETGRTVWEELANVAESTQTALYYDEYDVLQVRARRSMYSTSRPIQWVFDAAENNTKLPDVVELERNDDLDANQVDVVYSPASFSDFNNGFPKMEAVWEPEDDVVVLRSSDMFKDLLTAGTALWIRQSDAAFWPYTSLVNIRGEILRYVGKEYVYYVGSGNITQTTIVTSQDEKNAADDASNPDYAWKNYFTGKLVVTERGLYGTEAADHRVIPTPYSGFLTDAHNAFFQTFNSGWAQKDGYVQMTNRSQNDGSTFHIRKSGNSVIAPVTWIGTRMRFPNQGAHAAGIYFDGNSIDSGYFVEIITTAYADDYNRRSVQHEVSLWSQPTNTANNARIKIDGGTLQGSAQPIISGKWYNVDVVWVKAGPGVNETVMVYLDGVTAGKWTVPSGQRPTSDEGRFGMYLRGSTTVDFEYIYATDNTAYQGAGPDDASFLDLREGGLVSGYIQREWKYDPTYFNTYFKGKYFPQMVTRTNFVFDEFGPVVHEIREFDIKFKSDLVPVAHSFLYFSNSSQVVCPVYNADSFGAQFLLVNASRDNAVVKGEDTFTFGPNDSVNQSIFIYGRPVYQDEERRLTRRNEDSIRRRGLIKTEFTSRYIQSDEMARDIGDWILEIWGAGSDEVIIESFGNTMLQIGDLVAINYPDRHMTPDTHHYFVVGVEGEYDSGYRSRFTLHRVKV